MKRQKFKPRKCRNRKCRALFQPTIEWQFYCKPGCRFAEGNHRRADLVRKAGRIIAAQEKGAAV